MIYGISGYAGSGKDEVASMIQKIQPDKDWQVKKFAGKLKTVASILTGIPEKNFEDQDFKNTMLGNEWANRRGSHAQMSVREFLQILGTEAIRIGLHRNAWVNALMCDYKTEQGIDILDDGNMKLWFKDVPNWLITDCRFNNEAISIKERGGIVIRVNRPGVFPVNNHPSEIDLDRWNFDAVINNDGNLNDLYTKVKNILENENIIPRADSSN
jgi:hypothetical protein